MRTKRRIIVDTQDEVEGWAEQNRRVRRYIIEYECELRLTIESKRPHVSLFLLLLIILDKVNTLIRPFFIPTHTTVISSITLNYIKCRNNKGSMNLAIRPFVLDALVVPSSNISVSSSLF